MDTRRHLILVKGEDRTREIASCQRQMDTRRVHITFNNGKEYQYSQESIVWLQDPLELDPSDHWVYRGHQRLRDVASIQLFEGAKVRYWHLTLQNGQELSLPFDIPFGVISTAQSRLLGSWHGLRPLFFAFVSPILER